MSSILIRTPNWIGDAVMSMPFIKGVLLQKAKYDLILLTRPHLVKLFALLESDRIRIICEPGKIKFIKTASLLPSGIEKAFTLSPAFSAAFPLFLKGISPIFGMISRDSRFFLKGGVNIHGDDFRKTHLTNSFLSLLEKAGMENLAGRPALRVDKEVYKLFGVNEKRYYIIAPAAMYGKTKMWPVENFSRTVSGLFSAARMKAVILGGPNDAPLGEELTASAPIGSIIDLAGRTTLSQASSLMAGAAFTIANDSGLMHLSYINGTRTFAVFGSTSPQWTGPLFDSTVFYSNRDCSPCFRRVCPLGHYGCLKDIEPEEVINKILEEMKIV